MAAIVKDNIDEIKKLCERMQIQSLYLFGSGRDETKFTKNSDLYFNLKKIRRDNQFRNIIILTY
jgi:predicted nucleotidyltransferase